MNKVDTALSAKENNAKMHMINGVKSGIPIAIGYIPIAIAFGILAKSSGIPNHISVMMSLLIFAGASQFVGVNLLALNAGSWEIIMTTFILNFRHFLMTASVSQRIDKNLSKGLTSLLAFGITDETFSMASMQKEESLHPLYILGLNTVAYSAWNIGTWIGVFAAATIPQNLQNSMGVALYAMFIGLLIPSVSKSKSKLICAFIAVVIHAVLYWASPFKGLSTGWNIIISTIVAALAGAIIFPGEEN